MGLVESLAFPNPPRDFSSSALLSHPNLFYLNLCTKQKTITQKVPAIHIKREDSKFTIICSHGNAEDLGLNIPFLERLSQVTEQNVIGYEYPGYSISEPQSITPTEQGCYNAINAAFKHAITTLNVSSENIVLFGRSLGTGPTVDLAARLGSPSSDLKIAGCVLISPLSSAIRTQFSTGASLLSKMDIFKSINKVNQIECQTYIIHGNNDRVVPCSNGRTLHALLKNPVTPWWIHGRGHNDLPELEVMQRVKDFLQNIQSESKESKH
jgi:pimeloyl-ACP methyl ester carboxylesterase